MKIHLYALCWNEEKMLPYFFQHYEPFVDQFFIYDHQSTDSSRLILQNNPKVSMSEFMVKGDSFVLTALEFYNNIWKNSRGIADWVILCNIDEHFYHSNWLMYLQDCLENKISVVRSKGYEMVSDNFPNGNTPLYQQICYGKPEKGMNKIACFNPNAITETNFVVGRHTAAPQGSVVYPKKIDVKLLHFKALGLDYLMTRYAELSTGLKSIDCKRRFGRQYLHSHALLKKNFLKLKSMAIKPLSAQHIFLQKIRKIFYGNPKNY